MLSQGADVSALDAHGDQPLHHAVRRGDIAIVHALLKAGADPDAVDGEGDMPLYAALTVDDQGAIFAALLHAGAEVRLFGSGGVTLLHTVVEEGRGDLVPALLHGGADVHAMTYEGDTPLHLACTAGDAVTAVALLQAGGSAHTSNSDGVSPLDIACDESNVELVRALLSVPEATPEAVTALASALHDACAGGDAPLVAALLAAGVDVNVSCGENTALHAAANCDQDDLVDIVRMLLDAGAVVDAVTSDGHTPLHYACKRNNVDTVEVLVDAGSDVMHMAHAGQWSMGIARKYMAFDVIAYLMVHTGGVPMFHEWQRGLDALAHVGWTDAVDDVCAARTVWNPEDLSVITGATRQATTRDTLMCLSRWWRVVRYRLKLVLWRHAAVAKRRLQLRKRRASAAAPQLSPQKPRRE
jgi:ankyrin